MKSFIQVGDKTVVRKVTLSAPLPAKQKRSRQTRDALLAAGWKLLSKTDWDRLTVNDIVAVANSSVGSFYSRFADKDSFFDSLAAQWLERRHAQTKALFDGLDCTDDYVNAVVMDIYRSLANNRNFWRAAILRGVAVPEFWVPFSDTRLYRTAEFTRLRADELGRALSAQEIRNIRFAFQMMYGVVNNSILNRPGPIMIETREFELALVHGFRAVAGIDGVGG